MRSFPFSPRSRSRKESDSANAYEPAWRAPAVGEKRLGRPRKIADATRIAHLRSQGHSWREITKETGINKGTAQRTVSSLPKNVSISFADVLTGTASFQDPYLISGWFMGSHRTREDVLHP
jgi:hypothetical protein